MPSKTKLQFYADECFPITSVKFLKSLGYSIIHAYDLKFTGKSDYFHLAKAKKLNLILITLDRDFIYYEQANLNTHPGVLIIQVGSAVPYQISKVCTKVLKHLSKELLKNAVIKVSNKKIVKIKDNKIIFQKDI